MSEACLSVLYARLEALPAAEVQAPNLPLAVLLQEAHDLLTLLEEEAVWSALLRVGITREARTGLRALLEATRAAQSGWVALRERPTSSALQALEAQARALRSELLTVGRFNLRGQPQALSVLRSIRAGQGAADLIQDLHELAELFEREQAAFACDQSFEFAARVQEARGVAEALSLALSEARLDDAAAQALNLRNRAYTLLCRELAALRASGRYAFRHDASMRRRFVSAYLKHKAQRAQAARRAAESEQDAP